MEIAGACGNGLAEAWSHEPSTASAITIGRRLTQSCRMYRPAHFSECYGSRQRPPCALATISGTSAGRPMKKNAGPLPSPSIVRSLSCRLHGAASFDLSAILLALCWPADAGHCGFRASYVAPRVIDRIWSSQEHWSPALRSHCNRREVGLSPQLAGKMIGRVSQLPSLLVLKTSG